MNYIGVLNEDELTRLCNIVGPRFLKLHYRKNSKEFAKIKPGFRPTSLSDDAAIALAVKNSNKSFISSFLNFEIKHWFEEIDEFLQDQKRNGIPDDEAFINMLSKSVYCDDVSLYCKLSGKELSEKDLANLQKLVSEEVNRIEKESIQTVYNDEEENLKHEVKRLTKLLNDSKHELYKVNEDNERHVQELIKEKEDLIEKCKKVSEENDNLRIQIEDYHKREVYSDSGVSTELSVNENEHISLCCVNNEFYDDKIWLTRLADISENGQVIPFVFNDDLPPRFENRERLIHKDGPNDIGFVGIWNWTAEPNYNDPTKDYVITTYNTTLCAIEIVILPDCGTVQEIVEKLKNGIDAVITSGKTLFVHIQSDGFLEGVLCNNSDLDIGKSTAKLSGTAINLSQYRINRNDVFKASNNKMYYGKVYLGIPNDIVHTKDTMEIIKSIIIDSISWQNYKGRATKNEWKNFKSFVSELRTESVIEKIKKTLFCSTFEAEELLNEFVKNASDYIDANTIDDQIILSAINSNSQLIDKCKQLIRDEWVLENDAEMQQKEKEISEKKALIEELEFNYLSLNSRIEELKKDETVIDQSITEKRKLAEDVEGEVQRRIVSAQKNAAEFIASQSFVSNSGFGEGMKYSNAHYTVGISNDSEFDQNSSWNDVLETISCELFEAGVVEKYTRGLAAYLYSAYLLRYPVLIVGPNADNIVDAFSLSLYGRKAGELVFDGEYDESIVELCRNCDDRVIKIVNPFANKWISSIPRIIGKDDRFFVAVYPYADDVCVEPKGLLNVFLPVFTECIVDNIPGKNPLGGVETEAFEEYCVVDHRACYKSEFASLRMNMLVTRKLQHLIINIRNMLSETNADIEFLLCILPYALYTSQLHDILQTLEENNSLNLSDNLRGQLLALYGE